MIRTKMSGSDLTDQPCYRQFYNASEHFRDTLTAVLFI